MVTRLLQEIEHRAATTPSLDLYRLYRTTTPSAETIAQLCLQLSTDPGLDFGAGIAELAVTLTKPLLCFFVSPPSISDNGGDLSAFEAHVLGCGLKKLLRELPDPLVPSQWYDAFIEASRKPEFLN